MAIAGFLDGVAHEALSFVQRNPLGWWSPLIAFVMGLLNTLNPCTISILPLWGLYLFGKEDDSPDAPAPKGWLVFPKLRHASTRMRISLLFTTGMVVVLSLLAYLALQIRVVVFGAWNVPWVWFTLGGLTLLLGISVVLDWQGFAKLQGKTQGLFKLSQYPAVEALKPLLMGAAFALILSPCSTPFLLALTVLLVQSPHPAVSLLSIIAYSVGQGVLFLLLPVLLPHLQKLLDATWTQRLRTISGLLLVAIALWMMAYPLLNG
jgi:cytochrome c-type biogenesis protein